MKKFFIVFLLLILFIPLVSCTSNNEQDNTTPTQTGTNPTKTPNKPTPTPTVEDLYTVNYYVNGTFVYDDKTTIAKNYVLNTKDIILAWYKDKECTTVYNFNEKLTADINLYAKTISIKNVILSYFEKYEITEYYIEGDNEQSISLKILIDKTDVRGNILSNCNEISIMFLNFFRMTSEYDQDLQVKEKAIWNLETSAFGIATDSINYPYVITDSTWSNPKYDTFFGECQFKNTSLISNDNIIIRHKSLFAWSENDMNNIILSFINKSTSLLYITINTWKNELYGDKISTGGTYVLNVDLDKILAEGDN